MRIREAIKYLDSAIDKTLGITQNTILHRYGHWDKGIKEGDVIVQKGFGSYSFSEEKAKKFDGKDKYHIIQYTPVSTKGLVIDEQFKGLDEEEYLTGRNTRQYVLKVDDDKKEAYVLILPYR